MKVIAKVFSKHFLNLLIFILGSSLNADAITYYSRVSTGLWSLNSSWSTVGHSSATNTGTYPKAGDDVIIGDGHTINIGANAVCQSITVGQGASGTIEYLNARTYTIRVSRSVTINSGGEIKYTTNSTRTHWLFIGENLHNDGNMQFFVDANDYIELVFDGNNNTTIDGAGTFSLNRVTMQKTNPLSNLMDVKIIAFENATKELIVTSGYYIHNNNGSYVVNPNILSFTITKDATIEVPSGEMHFSPNTDFVYLNGTLLITGGSVKIGSALGSQGFRYAQVGTTIPTLKIISGSMEIRGGLTYRSVTPNSPFYFEMNSGTLLLNTGTRGSRNGVFNIVDNPNSSFIMTGGTITLQKQSGGGLVYPDFEICGNSGTVNANDGYVEFGNALTLPCTFNFVPCTNATLPNFKVTGLASRSIQLMPFKNNTDNVILHSLYLDANKTFDFNSILTNSGGNRTVQLAGSYDGLYTLFNDGTLNTRTGTLLIQSNEGLWVGGSSTTLIYNFTINNPFGVSINSSVNISNQLTLIDGIVYVMSPSSLTCQANARSNIGNSLAYIDGKFDQIIATTTPVTFNIPIGKLGNYRPIVLSVFHSNSTAVTYSSEMINSSARFLGYTLPPTLSWVSDVRYYDINRTAVSNLVSAQITLSYGLNDVVTDHTELRVAQYNGTSSWINEGGVGTANTSGYIISAPITSFNGRFTLGNTSGGTNPLPITLINFDVSKEDNHVLLNWATASEENADRFEIERSSNNNDFTKLGEIKSKGNSSSIQKYSFKDNYSFTGKNYYRLKMIDFDGTYKYSEIKYIAIKKEEGFVIYPNPSTNGKINIRNLGEIEGPINVKIINGLSQIVFSREYFDESISIDTKELLTGVYTVILQSANGFESSKLIIN